MNNFNSLHTTMGRYTSKLLLPIFAKKSKILGNSNRHVLTMMTIAFNNWYYMTQSSLEAAWFERELWIAKDGLWEVQVTRTRKSFQKLKYKKQAKKSFSADVTINTTSTVPSSH